MKSVLERFTEKYVVNEETGCWEWTAAINSGGYGSFWNGRTQSAHVFAWLTFKGFIPAGLELDHLCRVLHCVNPDHLEPVTHAENVRRGEAGKYLADKTHCPQGHEYAGSNLYVDKKGRRYCVPCTSRRTSERQARAKEAQRATA